MNPRKILILEWFIGGGIDIVGTTTDPSVASQSPDHGVMRQAAAMLVAVCEDFGRADLEVSVPIHRDFRNHPLHERLNKHQNISVQVTNDLQAYAEQAIHEIDFALIIAPESGGQLHRWCTWFTERGIKLLNPPLALTKLASNKNQLQSHLQHHGIAIAPGASAEAWSKGDSSFPPDTVLLLKPSDGCGGEGQRFVQSTEDLQAAEHTALHRWRVESWVDGTPVSVSCVGNGHTAPMFLPALRQSFVSGPPGEFSHGVDDLPSEWQHRARVLAEQTTASLPGFNRLRGFLGIDMVLGDRDVVIEINPRITMSYCQLRQRHPDNLAEQMLPPT